MPPNSQPTIATSPKRVSIAVPVSTRPRRESSGTVFPGSAPGPSFTRPPSSAKASNSLVTGQDDRANMGSDNNMTGGAAKKSAEECVDYLSYKFDAFDLHQCWKIATRKKDLIANGRRLENASWRKFFQMKFQLSTIDPASLNWQKDSDVVWLYGPFHMYEPLPILQQKYAAAAKAHAKAVELKPALKRRDERERIVKTLKDVNSSTGVESRRTSVGGSFVGASTLTPQESLEYRHFMSGAPTPPTGRKVAFFLSDVDETIGSPPISSPAKQHSSSRFEDVISSSLDSEPSMDLPDDIPVSVVDEEDWDNSAPLMLKR
ncbi:hypothetical protein HK097_009804, partial [Rhizophlyctis rosea]